jgi:hypothetical protein
MVQCIKNEKPEDPTSLIPDLSAELQYLIGKMLCKKPEDRFQSIDEIIPVLEGQLNRNLTETTRKPKSLIDFLMGKTPAKYWS